MTNASPDLVKAHAEAKEQGRDAQQAIRNRWYEANPRHKWIVRRNTAYKLWQMNAPEHVVHEALRGEKKQGLEFLKTSIPPKEANPETEVPQPVENPETEVPQPVAATRVKSRRQVVLVSKARPESRRLKVKGIKKDGTPDKRCKLNTLQVKSDQVASQAPSSGQVVVVVRKAGLETRRVLLKGVKKDGTLDKRYNLKRMVKEIHQLVSTAEAEAEKAKDEAKIARKKAEEEEEEEELNKKLGHMSHEEQFKLLKYKIRVGSEKITKSLVIRYVKAMEKESEKKGNPEEFAKVDYKAWLRHLSGEWRAARDRFIDLI